MLYKFKSKAAGDVIMLGPNGDQVLRIIGKQPALKGIIEVGAMQAAIAAIEAAIAENEAQPAASEAAQAGQLSDELRNKFRDDMRGGGAERVSLRQRAWPLVEMLKRSVTAGEPIVWGV